MHHWRDSYFAALRDASHDAKDNAAWADYSTYCAELERGLRKQAHAALARFVHAAEHWVFEDRRQFVRWVLRRAHRQKGEHMLLPHPVLRQLIGPTLREWAELEPTSVEVRRWRMYSEEDGRGNGA